MARRDPAPKQVEHGQGGKGQKAGLAMACYEETVNEVDDGWLAEAAPLPAVGSSGMLSPRYAIPEQHGKGPWK